MFDQSAYLSILSFRRLAGLDNGLLSRLLQIFIGSELDEVDIGVLDVVDIGVLVFALAGILGIVNGDERGDLLSDVILVSLMLLALLKICTHQHF